MAVFSNLETFRILRECLRLNPGERTVSSHVPSPAGRGCPEGAGEGFHLLIFCWYPSPGLRPPSPVGRGYARTELPFGTSLKCDRCLCYEHEVLPSSRVPAFHGGESFCGIRFCSVLRAIDQISSRCLQRDGF